MSSRIDDFFYFIAIGASLPVAYDKSISIIYADATGTASPAREGEESCGQDASVGHVEIARKTEPDWRVPREIGRENCRLKWDC